MSQTKFTYHTFNHLREIIPPHLSNECKDEIKAFIINYFEKKEIKLTYCLLELVALKENGVGEGYIYSDFNKEQVEMHWKEYVKIVEGTIKDYKGGVAMYKEWFDSGEHIFIGENSKSYSRPASSPIMDWFHEEKSSKGKISPPERIGLNQKFVEKYLSDYAQRFYDFIFKKHNHYAILIKPLGYVLYKSKEIKSYGNLYLHFAMDKPLSIGKEEQVSIWKEFLKDFIFVWYRNRADIISELQNEVSSQLEVFLPKVNMERENAVDHLNTIQHSISESPLIDYFRLAHQSQLDELFKMYNLKKLDKSDKIILKLIMRFKHKNLLFDKDIQSFFDAYKNLFGKMKAIPPRLSEESIKKITDKLLLKLSGRKVFIVCYCLLNISVEQLYWLFLHGKITTEIKEQRGAVASFKKLFLYGLKHRVTKRSGGSASERNRTGLLTKFISDKEQSYLDAIEASYFNLNPDKLNNIISKNL